MKKLLLLLPLALLCACANDPAPEKPADSVPPPPKEMTLSEIVFDIQQMIPDSMMGPFYYLYYPGQTWEEYKAHSPAEVIDTTKEHHSTPAIYFAMMSGTMNDTLCDFSKVRSETIHNHLDWEENMGVSYSDGKCASMLLLWFQGVRPQFMKPGWKEKEEEWKRNLVRIQGDYGHPH